MAPAPDTLRVVETTTSARRQTSYIDHAFSLRGVVIDYFHLTDGSRFFFRIELDGTYDECELLHTILGVYDVLLSPCSTAAMHITQNTLAATSALCWVRMPTRGGVAAEILLLYTQKQR